MGIFDSFRGHHEEVQNGEHKGKISHELIAGAASYEAIKAYEDHCQKNGKPQSHAEAKALLAGLAGAFADKLIETKGLDFLDKQKAKRHAEQNFTEISDEEIVQINQRF